MTNCTSCEENLSGMSIKVLNLMKTEYCNSTQDVEVNEYCESDGILDNLIDMITDALSTTEGQTVVNGTCEKMNGVCDLTFTDATCGNDVNS